nr:MULTISPECIES: alpha/beta hydrolase [unclassified Providencia]
MEVSYLEEGQGRPLVLIHGVGMCAETWEEQIESLSAFYQVIAVDMPGHGYSSGFVYRPELQNYVSWMGAFLQSLGLADVILVGHSMGGLITGGVCIEYPQLIKGAVIISSVYRRDEQAKIAVRQRAIELASGQAQIDAPLQRWFDGSKEQQQIRRKVMNWLNQVNLDGYAKAYYAFANGDDIYAKNWHEISCPLLVITGENDNNSSPSMAIKMAENSQKGRAIIIPGERHMLTLTASRLVSYEIKEFVENICNSENYMM